MDASHKLIHVRGSLFIEGSVITGRDVSIMNLWHIHLNSGYVRFSAARWVANRSSVHSANAGIVGKWACKQKVVYCFRPAL